MFTVHFPFAVLPAPAVRIPARRSGSRKRGLTALAAALAAALSLAFVLLPASAETKTWPCGDQGDNVICTLEDNGKFTVSGKGKMADYKDYYSRPWNGDRSQITSLEIGEGVTSIGTYAFAECTGFTAVTIPQDVTSIGKAAFAGCIGLTSVTFSGTPAVETIGQGAFGGCTSLGSVTIPESVTSIGMGAFNNCVSLESVIFSGKPQIETIGDYAFHICTALSSFTIPASVTSIGESPFYSCVNLSSITIIRSDHKPLSLGKDVFLTASAKQAALVWEGPDVYRLGFSIDNTDDYDIIGSDGSYALNWEKSYETGDAATLTPEVSMWPCGDQGDNVTCALEDNGKFTVSGEGKMADYKGYGDRPWHDDCSQITSLEIGEGVTSIGTYAFASCTGLTAVTISQDVTAIGDDAFLYSGLSSVEFSGTPAVETIGYDAFGVCTSLGSITIPESVTKIGEFAFIDCSSLESVTFAGTPAVETIGDSAFRSCSSLTSIAIPASVTSIEEDAFVNCTNLSPVTIIRSDHRPLSLGKNVFMDVKASQAALVWEGPDVYRLGLSIDNTDDYDIIGSDGSYALSWAKSYGTGGAATLTPEVSMWPCGDQGDNVTCTLDKNGKFTVSGTGNMADYEEFKAPWYDEYWDQIKSAEIGEGVTSIGNNVFYECNYLISVTFSDTPDIERIGEFAFAGTALGSVTIPASVTSIGINAFFTCMNLKNVTIIRSDDTSLSLGNTVFQNTNTTQATLSWDGEEDLMISFGLSDSQGYEIKNNDGTWTLDWSNAGEGYFYGTLTVTSEEKNYALEVTAPSFDPVYTGYEQPEAKPAAIINTGNVTATVSKVEIGAVTVTKDGGETPAAFILNKTDGTTIAPGTTDTLTYTVQPAVGLEAGTYTAELLVHYDAEDPASASLTFTVSGKAQEELTVSVSEDDPTVPQYEKPEGTLSETVTYSGKLADGTPWGPSEEAPSKPGTYTVTVICETADTVYTGSAEFTLEKTEPEPEPKPEPPHRLDLFRLCEDCTLPATGFSAVRPTALSEQPKELRYTPVRMRLMIPTLDQDVELVTIPRQEDSWAVDWLGADAGILAGSALPGEGLSLIAAHNTLNDTAYGPFALLSALEPNDLIVSAAEDGTLHLFRVYANELLAPDDTARLEAIALREKDTLVLVTCENESPDGGYLSRRAVFAKPL